MSAGVLRRAQALQLLQRLKLRHYPKEGFSSLPLQAIPLVQDV